MSIYSYKNQPGNVEAWRFGEACSKASKQPTGDYIDSGLALLRELEAKGYGIVQLAARPVGAEVSSDAKCTEDDGCPTERAVLQRFWREHQDARPAEAMAVATCDPNAMSAAIEALGEHHVCNQGCGEGHCFSNEQRHQVKLAGYAAQYHPAADRVAGPSEYRDALRELVNALGRTTWTSWQTTAEFDEELRDASELLAREGV